MIVHIDNNNIQSAVPQDHITATRGFNLPKTSLLYKYNRNAKRSLSLELPQKGIVKLDVYDFYGKHICTLFEGQLSKGKTVFEENGSWKNFSSFHGIVFFTITINNRLVLRKLIPKVD
ncbi:MAG: hypothetical protein HQK83_17195 [Fibrobacteria bacterium]|nr:hypothetical protein [Fibrobacteria bacterium]